MDPIAGRSLLGSRNGRRCETSQSAPSQSFLWCRRENSAQDSSIEARRGIPPGYSTAVAERRFEARLRAKPYGQGCWTAPPFFVASLQTATVSPAQYIFKAGLISGLVGLVGLARQYPPGK